jgi:hypothetical protein
MSSPSISALTRGHVLEGVRRRPCTKNDMKPSFTPCVFSKSSWYLVAQRHDRGHVDLVEGGEHRGLVLSGDEALSDLARAAGSSSGASAVRRSVRRRRSRGHGAAGAAAALGAAGFVRRRRACRLSSARPALPEPSDSCRIDAGFRGERRTAGDGAAVAADGGPSRARSERQEPRQSQPVSMAATDLADFHFIAGGNFERRRGQRPRPCPRT